MGAYAACSATWGVRRGDGAKESALPALAPVDDMAAQHRSRSNGVDLGQDWRSACLGASPIWAIT